MKWANFFHIYQPAEQQLDILEAVVAQSYRPMFDGLKEHKKASITLNISGSLFELFDKYGFKDIIESIKELVGEGRLELTGSAKYHALLPFLSDDEIIRQIKLNTLTLKKYLGEDFNPKGFFPPEMAYDERLPKILESLGFDWIILDEITKNGETDNIDYHKIYKIKETNLKAFFRERKSSNLIMSAVVRSYSSLKEVMHEDFTQDRYLITAMDGETFGHHRPGLTNLLFEMFDSHDFDLVTISQLSNFYKEIEEVVPIESTWATSKRDIEHGIQFLSWKDPENKIHTLQWQLVDLALKCVYSMDVNDPKYSEIRSEMDIALASDHFWWASGKPWWSVEMIEDGAYRLMSIIRSVPNASKEEKEEALNYYEKIISTAFNWQRTGKIRLMNKELTENNQIPFKDRTWGIGGEGGAVYIAFINMMKELETKAVEKEEYEKAILWRDAIWRIEHKTDIYEAVNAIDLLRTEIPNEEVEKIIEKYREDYRRIRGGQPEQRGI